MKFADSVENILLSVESENGYTNHDSLSGYPNGCYT